MKSTCIIVAFVAFVAIVKADTATQSPFDKAVAEALNNIEAGAKKFQEATGIKTEFDKAKVQDFLKNGLGDNKKKIEELLKSLEDQSKPFSEDLKKNVENLQKQFTEAVKNLNTPETQGNVKKLQQTFEEASKKLVVQVQEVAKSAGVTPPPELTKKLQDLAEELGKGAKAVQEKLQQAIADAQKKPATS